MEREKLVDQNNVAAFLATENREESEKLDAYLDSEAAREIMKERLGGSGREALKPFSVHVVTSEEAPNAVTVFDAQAQMNRVFINQEYSQNESYLWHEIGHTQNNFRLGVGEMFGRAIDEVAAEDVGGNKSGYQAEKWMLSLLSLGTGWNIRNKITAAAKSGGAESFYQWATEEIGEKFTAILLLAMPDAYDGENDEMGELLEQYWKDQPGHSQTDKMAMRFVSEYGRAKFQENLRVKLGEMLTGDRWSEISSYLSLIGLRELRGLVEEARGE
jgi:hypothetical protein